MGTIHLYNRVKKIYILFLLLNASLFVQSQSYWVKTGGGQGMDEILDMDKDANGNLYAVGYFTGTCVLQTNPNVILNSNGGDDILIVKYSANGNLIWAKKAGGTSADKAYSVAVTPNGDCYVTGFYNKTANFDNTIINAVNNSQDIFIAKYNTNGQLQWVKSGGGNGIDIANGISTDANGNCVVTGQIINSGNFAGNNFTTHLHPITNQFTYDIFIARYDSAGNLMWFKHGLAPYTDRGMSVTMDSNSNAYVVLQFSDTITFNNVYNNSIYNAIGILKLDSAGNEIWFKKIGGGNLQIGYNISIHNNSELLLTGDYKGNIIFFNSPTNTTLNAVNTHNVFTAKYNLNGNLLWAKSIGSSNKITSRNVATDSFGNVYIIGHFECKLDEFASVYGQATFNSVGYNDIYTVKYSPSGDFEWARHIGGKNQDFGYGIVVNNIDRPILAGSFRRNLNIPSQSFNSNTISHALPFNCNDMSYNKYMQFHTNGLSDIFIADAIDLTRLPYNYYASTLASCNPLPVKGCINNMSAINVIYYNNQCWGGIDNTCANDTISVCDSTIIYVATHTSMMSGCGGVGPNFKYYWSTGDSLNRALKIYQSGLYTVNTITEDGCFSFDDSIYVNVNTTPHITVSDDIPIQTNSHQHYSIRICGPDTITLSGSNFANSSVNWSGGNLPSGGINDSIITVSQNGIYTFSTITPAGCSNYKNITVTIDTAPPVLSYAIPYLHINSPNFLNDTITFCAGQNFTIDILDSLTGNCLSDISQVQLSINNSNYNTFSPNPLNSCTYGPFTHSQSGWYTYNFIVKRMVINACGMDTIIYFLSDSIYMNVNPLPPAFASLTGNSLLCPGDTNLLIATGTGNYTWSGPGIVMMVGDSMAYIVSQGTYYVTTNTVDSITGCTNYVTVNFNVIEKKAILTSLPVNALICPNDSVLLIAPPGVNYEWYGPLGYITTTSTNSIYVNAPGFYHVIMIDSSGCELVSNMFEIKQYGTPDLIITPGPHVCPGEIVTLEVTSSNGSIISWNTPLSGNDSIKQILQPGTYSCNVLSCNINTLLTATITHSNPIATITPNGSIDICNGDSVTLVANPGMVNYEWFPGGQNTPSISVTNAGTYYVKTTNMDGCDTISSAVQINVNSFPNPIINDTTICYGSTITLTAISNGNIQWYDQPNGGNIIGNNQQITVGPIYNDTVLYVAAYDTCFSNRVPLHIYIDSLSLSPPINANNLTCVGGTITLTTPYYSNAQYFWTGPNNFTSNADSITILNVSFQDSGTYSLYIMANGCISNTSSVNIQVVSNLPAPSLIANTNVCEGDTLFLNMNGIPNNAQSFWYGPNGINFNTANVTLLNIQTFQQGYYYGYYVTGACTSLVDSVLINVLPAPQIISISSNAPICEGDSLVLNANATIGATYFWNGPQNFSSNQNNPVINNVTTSNGGNYSLYLELNGCSSSVQTINVIIYNTPSLTISGDTNLCVGETIQLNAVSNNGLINWYYNNQLLNSGNHLIINNASNNNSGIYNVIASNAFCSIEDSINITISPIPIATIMSNNSPVCSGDSIIILSDSVANANYYWYYNGNLISTLQNLIIPNADSSNNGIYTLQIEINQCQSDTVNNLVIVLPTSGSLFTYQEINVCDGDSISLPFNCPTNIIYQWTGPNGFSSNNCNPFNGLIFNPSHSGTYYLTATLGNCSNNSDSLKVIVHDVPTLNLGNDTTICSGDEIILNPGNYNYYYWNNNDTTPQITVNDSGLYFVYVSNNYYCWASDSIYINLENCSYIQAPNIFTPNGDGMNDYFRIIGRDIENLEVEIFDRWGNLIYNYNSPEGYWDGTSIRIKRLVSEGVYYYTAIIQTKNGSIEKLNGFVQLLK
ncbi:MAG: gliding motility-associated C-terminal domain-containing protein [Bacteroidia bacterium]